METRKTEFEKIDLIRGVFPQLGAYLYGNKEDKVGENWSYKSKTKLEKTDLIRGVFPQLGAYLHETRQTKLEKIDLIRGVFPQLGAYLHGYKEDKVGENLSYKRSVPSVKCLFTWKQGRQSWRKLIL